MNTIYDLVILGGGSAGWAAGIYAARAGLAPLVIEGRQPGGQLTLTTEVENYPGVLEIVGPELMDRFKQQAERFGAKPLPAVVTKVIFGGWPFRIELDDGTELFARALIAATGASEKLLGIPGESRLIGYGVSTCATCDGAFFKDKVVAIIGGGDTAMEEAQFLTRFSREVIVVHRRPELRASKVMQERALRNPKIRFVLNSAVDEVLGVDRVEAIRVRDLATRSSVEMQLDGVFIAVGRQPNTELFRGALELDQAGYVVTEPRSTRTNIPGVFACGNVQDPRYRQVVTSAGTGCMAALDAERWLEERHDQE